MHLLLWRVEVHNAQRVVDSSSATEEPEQALRRECAALENSMNMATEDLRVSFQRGSSVSR